MAAPTPLAEDFISCLGGSITVGTSPDVWSGTITDGGLTYTYETDEMTNLSGGGAYEDVKTVSKYEGDITVAWKTTSPPPMDSGDIFHTVVSAPAGGPVFTGKFRYNGFNYPILNPKAGLKLKGKITSQGPIVRSIAT